MRKKNSNVSEKMWNNRTDVDGKRELM